MTELAIDGGEPVRDKEFPSWPKYGEEEEEGLMRVLHSRKWFSGFLGGAPGTEVEQLENEFSDYHDTKYCIATANGSAALEISLRSTGIGAGDEVIVPAYTFIATATAALQLGAVPRIVDIEPKHCCIDPSKVAENINEKTKAIIPVYYGGQIANMEELLKLSEEYEIPLLADACHAHGSVWKDRSAGSICKMASFSFQESKTMTAGEGGMILTDDEKLAKLARSYRSNGRKEGRPGYEHHRLGWNYRMNEFQAAILRAQFNRLESQVEKRTQNAEYLREAFEDITGFEPLDDPEGMTKNGHYLFPIQIDLELFDVNKSEIEESIKAEGIPCSTLYLPVNRSPLFRKENWETGGLTFFSRFIPDAFSVDDFKTPVADQAFDEIIELPQNVLLGEKEDMDDVIEGFSKVSENLST